MSNRSPKILWPIDYSSMTSITHWCNWLLIDDPSITHHLLYYARKTLLAFLYHFFSFVILLSVLDAFFLVSGDPEDPALQEKGNELLHQSQIGGRNLRICRKWPLKPCTKTASIHRTELLKNLQNWTTLTGQPSRYGSTTNGKEILENLLNFNFHVLLKLKRINRETSVYI